MGTYGLPAVEDARGSEVSAPSCRGLRHGERPIGGFFRAEEEEVDARASTLPWTAPYSPRGGSKSKSRSLVSSIAASTRMPSSPTTRSTRSPSTGISSSSLSPSWTKKETPPRPRVVDDDANVAHALDRHLLACGGLRASAGEDVEGLLQVALEHAPADESHGRGEEPSLPFHRRSKTRWRWLPLPSRGSTVRSQVPPGCQTFESSVVPTTRLSDHW